MSSRFSMEEEGDLLRITIARYERMEEKLQSLEKMKEEIGKQDEKLRIQRISAVLRDHEDTEKYYVPRAISIGPLHHNDRRLEETEGLKLKMTTLFMMEHKIEEKVLYEKIERNIDDLRSRYVEEDIRSYDNQDLTWIFLVDGCSTLYHMDAYVKSVIPRKAELMVLFENDIFLLENQLPFKLLQLIMGSCRNEESQSLMKSIYLYIYNVVLVIRNSGERTTALQRAITAYDADKESISTTPPTHLLDLFRNILLRDSSLIGSNQERKQTAPKSSKINKLPNLRSASQLKDAGIKIKPSEKGSIKDIRFTREKCFGVLYVPTLLVNASTGARFMNLVAYEMCPDFYNDHQVTSYLSFMNVFIDQPNDVKILRDAGVLLNFFGSEEGVAELFKSFRNSGALGNSVIFFKVQCEIQMYYDRTARTVTWITQGLENYFGTIWKTLASIAVVLGLALTFIQTWYAVKEKEKK